MVLAEAPTLRPAPERPMTVPRDTHGLPPQLETILKIFWDNIQPEVIVPLLEADDIASAWHVHWDAFQRWSHMASNAIINVLGERAALLLAEDAEKALRSLNADRGENLLGHTAAKAFDSALELKGLVRQSVSELFEEKETFEAAGVEFGKVEPALVALDFCAVAITEYLTKENQSYCANAKTLAIWSFHYADMAYGEWGVVEVDLGFVSPLKAT